MASFATMDAAEARAKTMVANNSWYEAHSARAMDGTIVVRFRRFMTVSASPQNGAWVETSDDSVT